MKNEIVEFFSSNEMDFDVIIENARVILSLNKSNDNRSLVLLNILHEFIKDGKSEYLLSQVNDITSANKNISNILSSFIKEEQLNIMEYFNELKFQCEESYLKLIDFEWKFVGLSTMENFEKGIVIPKILIQLKFNNGINKHIETDFANLKKLHEEIEENLSSFNSSYARRIENFSK